MTLQQLKAMKLALEALEFYYDMHEEEADAKAITAIKEALAEHAMREVQRLGQEIEQEPVVTKDSGGRMTLHLGWDDLPDGTKLYATPPQRTWVGLTDEEIDYFIVHRLTIATKNNLVALIRICEAKLKENNQ